MLLHRMSKIIFAIESSSFSKAVLIHLQMLNSISPTTKVQFFNFARLAESSKGLILKSIKRLLLLKSPHFKRVLSNQKSKTLLRTLAPHIASVHQENTTQTSKLHQSVYNLLDDLVLLKIDNVLSFSGPKLNYICFIQCKRE